MDEDERCQQCGSTELVLEEDGMTYCANGHLQARGAIIGEDGEDFGRQGKTVRKKASKGKQRVSRGRSLHALSPLSSQLTETCGATVLRGARAYQLFLQCWQFILWKQCHALVHRQGLAAELWRIVRDLWTLWLSRLENRLHNAVDPHPPAGTDSEGEPSATQPEETNTEPGSDEGEPVHEESKSKSKSKSAREGPMLVDTVALIHLGILMLRRPIGLAVILEWILQEEIPYIRAIRHVPQEMKDRLPAEYHHALDTTRILEADDLQLAVLHVAKMFNVSFGMVLPPLNDKVMLLSHIRTLALPIEVYGAARRLNTILEYDFSYPNHTSTADSTRRRPTTYPEAQLMSLIVIATKLLFPFDSDTVKRYPKDSNDPTSLRMDWTAWLEAKANFDNTSRTAIEPGTLPPGDEIRVTDGDILTMTDRQLDQYMDWYQRTWTNSSPGDPQRSQESSLDKDILDMFPLQDVAPNTTRGGDGRSASASASTAANALLTARIQHVQSSLQSRRAIDPAEEAARGIQVLRPGAMYPRLRDKADLDGAGQVVRVFHEEAAKTTCLSVEALLRAVNRTEEKIERWLRDRRREEVLGEERGHGDGDEGGYGYGCGFASASASVREASREEKERGRSRRGHIPPLASGEATDMEGGLGQDLELESPNMKMLPERR